MKQYILALVLAVVSASVAFAVNPIKEGNMISGHVIVKGTEEKYTVCHGFDYRQWSGNGFQ